MDDIIRTIKSLEDSSILRKGDTKAIENKEEDFLICYWIH